MAFSMIQIMRDVEHKEIYFSLISGTIGTFFPNPQAGGTMQEYPALSNV